jgi:hypothetical protein
MFKGGEDLMKVLRRFLKSGFSRMFVEGRGYFCMKVRPF